MGAFSIAANEYVSFTTFRKNGEAKTCPVWIADLGDGTVGFTTASSSWKAKRLANNSSVRLQPSDSRGNVLAGSVPLSGTAVVEIGGPSFERIRALIKDKYGWKFTAINAFYKVAKLFNRGDVSDSAVIVTLDDA
ncbi:MAG: PPOX class F420-dependent oxidoreductase [Acidimicrobiales bacterium]|nr:PPOX class F420-dependent oxidoreductase [Acidimicrobiales bacterium]